MGRLVRVLAAAIALAACGDDEGTRTLDVRVDDAEGGLVDMEATACERADNQLVASGVVRNGGDAARNVNLQARFVDDDGVRVELATDSVSDLQRGESARWEATVYTDDAAEVVGCEVSVRAS